MHAIAQPDTLGRYLAGSIGLHIGIAGILLVSGMLKFSSTNWGSQHASGGSVGVTLVKSIPIMHDEAPENPLANDSKSELPQEPAPVKFQKQVKAPAPDAVALPSKTAPKISPKQQSTTAFRPAQQYAANQVYSAAPQAASSKMYGVQGSAGIDLGPASVLGARCGAYVSLMRDAIANKWNTAGIQTTAGQRSAIRFTIAPNGAVSRVALSAKSGNVLLDASAQRAVEDANPLPPLSQGCDKTEATVELWFQLK